MESGPADTFADRKDSEPNADISTDTQPSPNTTPEENEDPGGSPKNDERLEMIVEENEAEAEVTEL